MITLNLLDNKDIKKTVKYYLLLLTKDILFSLLLLVSILAIIFLVAYFLLIKNFIDVSQTGSAVIKGSTMTEEVRQINHSLTSLNTIQEGHIDWVSMIIEINDQIDQEQIQITNWQIDQKKGLVVLQGKALDRASFLALQEKMEGLEIFKEVKSPLTNLLLAQQVNFKLEMQLNDDYVQDIQN